MAMFLDQPFKRAATNVSSEPLVTDAADCIDVCKVRKIANNVDFMIWG